MNYYRRYVGDYLRDTAHLSMLEHGAYTILLDHYYSTGKALPAGLEQLYRLCRAMTKLEQLAVRSVIQQYFPPGDDGLLHNPRADSEISIAQATIEKQRKSGVELASKRKSSGGSSGRSTQPPTVQPPTTNHQPPAFNHQEPTSNGKPLAPDATRRGLKVNGHRIEFDPEKGAFKGITEDQELAWQEAYPAVPIPPAIGRAAAWAKANPANRKSNWERYLVNWFAREQDKAARIR